MWGLRYYYSIRRIEGVNTPYWPDFRDYIKKILLTNSTQFYTARLGSKTILEGKKVLQTQSLIRRTLCNAVSSYNHSVSVSYSLCFILYTLWLCLLLFDECVNTHHFCHIWTAKTFKNTQKCLKIQKISLDCVFICFWGKKDWKLMKNEQSLHNWQFQSLNFQKLSKLVPGYSKHGKLSSKVLGDSQVVKLVL